MASKGAETPLWRDGFFWLALALTIFAVAPFALPGYFWGANDARHHVYFLFEYNRLVEDGIWWPRWSPDFAFGYGYPFFNIYGPLSHFVATLFLRFGGFSYTAAVETVFGLGIVASAAAMYAYVRSMIGRHAGLVAAVIYTYAPYHLLVLYVRGNLAESSAFVWLPLCLWTFRQCVRRPSLGWIAGAAVSYAGLLLTSNLIFVLFTPLLMLYILALLWTGTTPAPAWPRRLWTMARAALSPILGGVLGIGLGAAFLIPLIVERNFVRTDQWFDGRYDFRDDFLYFFQWFSPNWGFGVSQAGPDDPIGFQIGAVLLIFALIGFGVAWRSRVWRGEVLVLGLVAVGAALVGWVPFAPLWDWPVVGGVLQFAQFPWRWLPMTVLCLSVLAAFVAEEKTRTATSLSLSTLMLVSIAILGSYPLLQVQISEPAEGAVGLAALMRFQRDADEMTGSTAWVREIPTWSPMAERYVVELDEAGLPVTPIESIVDYESVDYETIAVGSVRHNTVMEEVYFCTEPGARPGDCTPRTDQQIVFNHFYYPGWRAYLLDGRNGNIVEELPIVPEGCLLPEEVAAAVEGVACPPFPGYGEVAARIAQETRDSLLGRMVVPVPAQGEGFILLRYEDTSARTLGQWISLGSLAVWVLVVLGAVVMRRRVGSS
jgi:hypothetical protein